MKNMDDDSDARTEVSYSENEDENVMVFFKVENEEICKLKKNVEKPKE